MSYYSHVSFCFMLLYDNVIDRDRQRMSILVYNYLRVLKMFRFEMEVFLFEASVAFVCFCMPVSESVSYQSVTVQSPLPLLVIDICHITPPISLILDKLFNHHQLQIQSMVLFHSFVKIWS